jgi:hypothetical protein
MMIGCVNCSINVELVSPIIPISTKYAIGKLVPEVYLNTCVHSTIVTMVESQPNKFLVVPAGLPVMVTNYKSLPSQSQNRPNIPKSLTQVSNHGVDGNPGNPGNRPNGQSAKDQPSSSISNNNKYKQYKYNMFIVCLYNNIFAPPQTNHFIIGGEE